MITPPEAARLRAEIAALGTHGKTLKSIAAYLAGRYDVAGAVGFVTSPQPLLNGAVPATLMQTEAGARRVEQLLAAAAAGNPQ